MATAVSSLRIWPMSDRIPGFFGLAISDVQDKLFLRGLPRRKGRFSYPSSGLSAEPGTVVLFQYRARIIASAVFLRDERFEEKRDGAAGLIHLDVKSIRVFDPVDVQGMRKVWPAFRGFGHVKQFLNPVNYPLFKRRLKRVRSVG
jgi:hypothetical protein